MPNWTNADIQLVREIIREAELILQGQLSLALSADQRATVLAGIYVAAGTAIFAGLGAATAALGTLPIQLVVPIAVTGVVVLVGAYFCISAVLPTSFHLPGNQPKNWYDDIESGQQLLTALGEESENYQSRIENNEEVLKTNAARFRAGANIGFAAPIVGILVWLLLSLPRIEQ